MATLMTALLLPLTSMSGQSAPATEPPRAEQCREAKSHSAENPMPARPVEPLNRQPLANQEKMVMYREGDCLKPLLVRENVGTEQR